MIPNKIGRYQIKGELGKGGIATVYRAIDANFDREVAIKVLPPQFLHDPTFLARFRREARTIALLEHHAIVPVYDFGQDNGLPFIVMRLMRGGSLAHKLAQGQGALSLAETARILGWLASGLDEAHGHGIIHRDIKPRNILFDKQNKQDTPRIADFGIAKLTQNTESFRARGGIIGTPQYMSPEQWRGEALDARRDVYALGVMLFQMLTGQYPYSSPTPAGLMFQHLTASIPNIHRIKPDLPSGCQQVICQAMAKEPDKRYSRATGLAADVAQLLKSQTPTRAQAQRPNRIASPSRKIEVPNLNLGNLGIGSTMISPKDGMVMLYVPAGPFLMGSSDSDPNAFDWEKPQRMVYLDGYWIDQTPVTNRMFAKFVAETGYQTQAEKDGWSDTWGGSYWTDTQGANWQHPRGVESNLAGKWDHPVVHVSWHDAQAYSQWAGRCLPTEAEWEKAARGTDGRLYPWGNAKPNDKLLNFDRNVSDRTPVSNYPAGASPYGALDMAGNVWEWTGDWYDWDYYNPQGATTGRIKVRRGGPWYLNVARPVRAGFRGRQDPRYHDDYSGVRCARSP